MTTAPSAAPRNIAATDSTLLANLGLLPFASEESAPMPVIVSIRTVVVRSGIASFRTAAFRVRAPSKRSEQTVEKGVRADRLGIRCRQTTLQTERPPPAGMPVPRIESVNQDSQGP